VLYDKNEVQVYHMDSKKMVFKATFNDTTEQLTRLVYVSNFEDDEEEEEEAPEENLTGEEQSPKNLTGHFLFAETKLIKEAKSSS